MAVLTQRTFRYIKSSPKVCNELHEKAKAIVTDLKSRDISQVYLDGNDEVIDILRLTCIEGGMSLDEKPDRIVLAAVGQNYQVIYLDSSRP